MFPFYLSRLAVVRKIVTIVLQSARYQTEVKAEPLLDLEKIVATARQAQEQGATRFCMGGAWRSPPEREKIFGRLLEIVTAVKELGLQVCVTLGMLTAEQAKRLKQAGGICLQP